MLFLFDVMALVKCDKEVKIVTFGGGEWGGVRHQGEFCFWQVTGTQGLDNWNQLTLFFSKLKWNVNRKYVKILVHKCCSREMQIWLSGVWKWIIGKRFVGQEGIVKLKKKRTKKKERKKGRWK